MTRRTRRKIDKHRVSVGMMPGSRMGEWGNAPKMPGRAMAKPRITATIQFDMIQAPGISVRKPARMLRA